MIIRRFQIRRVDRARAHVEGTLIRAAAHDLDALHVLDVVRSERKGSCAVVVDEDGVTAHAWFWWYQAKRGELVVCRSQADDADDPSGDIAVAYGNRGRRGVIDRVPRDVMELYLRSQSASDEP